MKLHEIIIASSDQTMRMDQGVLDLLNRLNKDGAEALRLSSSLTVKKLGNFYGMVKNDQCVGYVELSDTITVHKKKYQEIKIIFVIPEVRKTFAVGAFLIGLRRLIKIPIILGSDVYGGVLFSDGVKLVKALQNSALADVKILNLKSGEIRDLTDADLENGASKHLTLVFEDDDFPITVDKGALGNFFILENCEKTNYD